MHYIVTTLHILFPVPDGAPVNVTVEVKSSTTIFISWQPPEKLKQNGIITSYNVEINSSIVSVPTRKRNLSADSTNVTVTGIMYFYYR